ncbi:unnamed protein product [Fusarium graminearum]|uniref:Chromosome 1, complete genome n=2 Tax=Gibberella zeae TaxID=5518 RepID=A0A0E0RLR0_GIBZE|nr:hypothetical protein FG05_30165 [Fusarium graminearum]CAF3501696.1 unnamed protein product [Fusarium graminearum]CAF3574634.1 unnamed protein product [Fusarium graminearum]CAG1986117.1 unnamed protein product [Fusarium graminearum]CAG2013645.1 unnamed protein product [Fusarium graminearum]
MTGEYEKSTRYLAEAITIPINQLLGTADATDTAYSKTKFNRAIPSTRTPTAFDVFQFVKGPNLFGSYRSSYEFINVNWHMQLRNNCILFQW